MTPCPKTPMVRDEKHRRFIASLPCVICRKTDVQAAHIRYRQEGGTGIKPSDDKCVPLCCACHRNQHENGELKFWYPYGGYERAVVLAVNLYKVTGQYEKALITIMDWRRDDV